MNKELKNKLDKDIKVLIEKMETYSEGSDEYTECLDELKELYRFRKEIESDEKEYRNKIISLIGEITIKSAEVGVKAAGIYGNLKFNHAWMNKGLEFEETGAFTSMTFKNLFQKFNKEPKLN